MEHKKLGIFVAGPAVYFQTMSVDEVLNYAESYAETELEKSLLECLKALVDELELERTENVPEL